MYVHGLMKVSTFTYKIVQTHIHLCAYLLKKVHAHTYNHTYIHAYSWNYLRIVTMCLYSVLYLLINLLTNIHECTYLHMYILMELLTHLPPYLIIIINCIQSTKAMWIFLQGKLGVFRDGLSACLNWLFWVCHSDYANQLHVVHISEVAKFFLCIPLKTSLFTNWESCWWEEHSVTSRWTTDL